MRRTITFVSAAIALGFGLFALISRPDRRSSEQSPSQVMTEVAHSNTEHRAPPFASVNASETTTNQEVAGRSAAHANPQKTTTSALFEDLNSLMLTDQRKAVGELFQRKRSLSDTELLEYMARLLAIAHDATLERQFRADSIWALAGVAMLAKERGILTEQDIAAQCEFLVDVAGQENEELNVRRVAIKALGDLNLTNGVPVLTALLTNSSKWNISEIARPASIAIATLTPTEALKHIAPLLSASTNAAVADTAAYALGLTGNPAALPVLMANRGRLGDNLSVDNAVQALSSNVFAVLTDPQSPYLADAIRATESLWKPEQQAQFTPLLLQLLEDPETSANTRELTLKRLLHYASTLPLPEEKQLLAKIQQIVQREPAFETATDEIDRRLNATVLQPVAIEPRKPEEGP